MIHHQQRNHTNAARTEVIPGVWLDGRLALWIAEQRLLVVADLHWGFATVHRARGNLLPLWGDEEIAARLNALLADYEPAEMIWLGDVLHAAEGRAAAEGFIEKTAAPITLIAGNHDRRWTRAVDRTALRGSFFLHHGDTSPPVPPGCTEVIGHLHPAVRWHDGAGGRLKLPALVTAPHRLVLPAFSPWAAGTLWTGGFENGAQVWAVSAQRIFPVTLSYLSRSSMVT